MTVPGLDLHALRGLRPDPPSLDTMRQRMADHLHRHGGYVALSGGKDSVIVTHLAISIRPEVPIVHFDSGLDYPETQELITHLEHAWNLNLHRIPTPIPLLEALRLSGEWDHQAQRVEISPSLGDLCITLPASAAHRSFGPGELWGVRARESTGRAIAYTRALKAATAAQTQQTETSEAMSDRTTRETFGGLIHRLNRTVALGPIWDWSDDQVWAYTARHQLPVNPVYHRLQRLGAPPRAHRLDHILDGTMLNHGRLTWLRAGWPHLFEDLTRTLPRMREFI